MQFGLYLVRRGVITADQFVAALEARLRSTVPIHQLAIEEGLMSVRDVLEVLRIQAQSPDEGFADVARRLNCLTEETYHRLRAIQDDRQRPLGEILVEQDVLTRQRAGDLLGEFRQEQERRGPIRREQLPRLRMLRHRVPVLPALPESKVPKPLALQGLRQANIPSDTASTR